MVNLKGISDRYEGVRLSGKTNFRIVESYKILRTNLLFALSTTKSKTVLVSSVEPSAGKTVTSGNLAINLAQTGAKTLLLDADMRKPSQHKLFRLSNNRGLSHVLSRLESPTDVIEKDVLPNLDIIFAGSIPPNPSELLGSANMGHFLELTEKTYDYIIVDTPPIGVTTDALTVINSTAGLLLVGRYKQTTYDMVDKVIGMVDKVHGTLLGVVINDVDQKEIDNYYFSTSYKYGE